MLVNSSDDLGTSVCICLEHLSVSVWNLNICLYLFGTRTNSDLAQVNSGLSQVVVYPFCNWLCLMIAIVALLSLCLLNPSDHQLNTLSVIVDLVF